MHLQQRATERLDVLTAVTVDESPTGKGAFSTFSGDHSAQTLKSVSGDIQPISATITTGGLSQSITGATLVEGSLHSAKLHSSPVSTTSCVVGHLSSEAITEAIRPSPKSASEPTLVERGTISAQRFEDDVSALLLSASSKQIGVSKPFSNELILNIADLLSAIGKLAWSERPGTYLVLRLINEVKAVDMFVLEGFKDIDIPYTDLTLPNCVNVAGARHDFIRQQSYVLSPKSVDLVRVGPHRHLGQWPLLS